jgi:glycosyltransferase involved in cell wall biosynthesis
MMGISVQNRPQSIASGGRSGKPMTILNVGVNLMPSRGGIYRTVVSFSEVLANLNYNGPVINFGPAGESDPALSASCTFIKTTSVPLLRNYHFWHGFCTHAAEKLIGVPDLVFIHGLFFHAASAVASYCHNRGIPYVVVSHGSLDPYVFTYRWLRKGAWTRIYRKKLFVQSSAVLFSTRAEAEKASKWTAGGNVAIIPWSVDFVPDYDKPRARSMLLKQYGLPSSTRLALYCGRLDPFKRPLETIREFKAAGEKDWVLLVVGPPTERLPAHAVEAACAEPGARAIYAGAAYGPSLGNYYRAADLLMLLSHRENFSHVVAEALAYGVPVFLSRGVDLWRDLEPAGCSFVAPDDEVDAKSTGQALARVLRTDSEELAAAGQRGRDWVRTELSHERFVERVRTLCESVTKK